MDLYPDNMIRNIDLTHGLIYSQAVLLALTRKGISREDGYRLVQRNAMKVWDQQVSFKDALYGDEDICKSLTNDEIDGLFNIENRLKNLDSIFKKVGLIN